MMLRLLQRKLWMLGKSYLVRWKLNFFVESIKFQVVSFFDVFGVFFEKQLKLISKLRYVYNKTFDSNLRVC